MLKTTINIFEMGKEKKILIVDDDIDLCNLISEIISNEGFDVNRAYDSKSALEKINKTDYDLVIIDNRLGAENGINLITVTKSLKPDIKSIMITAYGNEETRREVKRLGVNEFVDKPFNISDLIGKVKNLLYENRSNLFLYC